MSKHFYFLCCYFFVLQFAVTESFAQKVVIIPDIKVRMKKDNFARSSQQSTITSYFNKTQIEKSNQIDLTQLFVQEQSIARLVNTAGDSNQAISIRGFGMNAVANSLIVVDGFPMTNPSLFPPNLNAIPLNDIAHIEIKQGSFGSLWGNQAVGGMVIITTKHPYKYISNSIVSLGSYNQFYVNYLLGDKRANGFFYKLFGVVDATKHYRAHQQQQENNGQVEFGVDYPQGLFSFSLQNYGNYNNLPGGLTEQAFNDNPQQAINDYAFGRYRFNFVRVLSKHIFPNDWLLETRMSYHQLDGTGFVVGNYSRNESVINFNPQLTSFYRRNKIIAGIYVESDYYRLNRKVIDQTSSLQNDLYLQIGIPLQKQFELTLGARKAFQSYHIINNDMPQRGTTRFHPRYQVFVTEQSLQFRPINNLTFYIRRDENFRFPKANEQTWDPTNTIIKEQIGVSLETGFAWLIDGGFLQLSLYRLHLDDEIAFKPMDGEANPFGTFANIGKTLRYGASMIGSYQLTNKFNINMQLNYVNARFQAGLYNGKLIPGVPMYNGNVNLQYRLREPWIIEYGLNYVGKQYAAEDNAHVSRPLPAYWLNRFSLQYIREKFGIHFNINNLFNKKYANYVWYNTFAKNKLYYPADGRNIQLVMKVNFG